MMNAVEKATRILWAFVELAFAAVLAIVLLHLILGKNAGEFVDSVAANVIDFTNEMQTPSLVGLAIVLALIYLIRRRMG